jgi:hypothetical protein
MPIGGMQNRLRRIPRLLWSLSNSLWPFSVGCQEYARRALPDTASSPTRWVPGVRTVPGDGKRAGQHTRGSPRAHHPLLAKPAPEAGPALHTPPACAPHIPVPVPRATPSSPAGGAVRTSSHTTARVRLTVNGRTSRCALARCWKCKVPRAAGSMARVTPLPNSGLGHIAAPGFMVDSCQPPINFRHRNYSADLPV